MKFLPSLRRDCLWRSFAVREVEMIPKSVNFKKRITMPLPLVPSQEGKLESTSPLRRDCLWRSFAVREVGFKWQIENQETANHSATPLLSPLKRGNLNPLPSLRRDRGRWNLICKSNTQSVNLYATPLLSPLKRGN